MKVITGYNVSFKMILLVDNCPSLVESCLIHVPFISFRVQSVHLRYSMAKEIGATISLHQAYG